MEINCQVVSQIHDWKKKCKDFRIQNQPGPNNTCSKFFNHRQFPLLTSGYINWMHCVWFAFSLWLCIWNKGILCDHFDLKFLWNSFQITIYMLYTASPISSRVIRIKGKSSPSFWTQRYNKYLTHPVFLVLTVSYETSFFLLFVLLMFCFLFVFSWF